MIEDLTLLMKNNKNQKGFGYGFGDALFGIKELQGNYDDIGKIQPKDEQPKKQMPPPKKPIVPQKNQTTNKAVVVKKEPLKQNVSYQSNRNNANTFKVNPGKEHGSFNLTKLQPCLVQEHVTELTLSGKPSRWEYNVFCDGVPSSAIVEKPMVAFNFDATEIKQGNLGNCYFISSLGSLGNLPKMLRERIPDFRKYNGTQKTYKVNMFESGKSVSIDVDNLFPKVYSPPIGDDISPMVLEKAYAQLYGHYQILKIGYSADALRDLTGAPSEFLELKDKAKIKRELEKIFKNFCPAVIDSLAQTTSDYITPKHSYILLDYKIKNNDFYLKIRDPTGRNKTSMVMPPQTENSIGEEEKKNGIFWADSQTVMQSFKVIAYSLVKYGYHYFYKTFHQSQLNSHQGSLLFSIKQPTTAHCSIHQKHQKFFDEKYSYEILRLLVGRVEMVDGKIKPIKLIESAFNSRPSCYVSLELQPGDYIMMGGIGNGGKVKCGQEAMTLSLYANNPNIAFSLVKNYVEPEPFLMQYIESHKSQFREQISKERLQRYYGPLYGYICLYYRNESRKQVLEQLTYNAQNLVLRDKKVSLKVGERKLILHGIGASNNCSHRFGMKVHTLYK